MGGGLNLINRFMQFLTRVTKNSSLTKEELDKLVKLKMQHWNYVASEHVKWLYENVSDDDYHLLIFDEKNTLVAYLNMVHLYIPNEENLSFLGIGNVVVNKSNKRQGYGLLLMTITNFFLKMNKFNGLLLCKESLNEFYKKAGWLLYNGDLLVNGEKFNESVFSNKSIGLKEMKINKYF